MPPFTRMSSKLILEHKTHNRLIKEGNWEVAQSCVIKQVEPLSLSTHTPSTEAVKGPSNIMGGIWRGWEPLAEEALT